MPFVRKPCTDTTELCRLGAAALEADQAVVGEVARLRHEGASWLDIAEALGTPRQNAWRKYRHYRWDPATGEVHLDESAWPP